jgi:hypothetical protein
MPLMAHRVDSLRCEGSERSERSGTCRERRERVDLTKMTRCGSRVGQNAVMHNVALGPLLDSQGEATDGVEPIRPGGSAHYVKFGNWEAP